MRTYTDKTQSELARSSRTGTPPPQPAHPVLQLQRAVGNQAVLRRLQAKLTVNQPGGPDEREADGVATQVMRMPAIPGSRLQRACACGGECRDCKAKAAEEVQRRPAADPAAETDVPPVVHDVLRSSGQPLDSSFRAAFEPRFGHDFSRVRVHTGPQAAAAAESIQAKAFTAGSSIVFGAGQYAPGQPQGQELLAHELTHVIQQGASAPAEQVQRKLVVEDPKGLLPGTPPAPAKENWEEVRDYIQVLKASFDVKSTGEVEPQSATTCAAPATVTVTDTCFCNLHQSTHPEPWKIKIDDGVWANTDEGARRVSVHSSRSAAEFGVWGGGAQAGQRFLQGNPRVLGHELCGHAHLFELGQHPDTYGEFDGSKLMGRPSHDATVEVENQVAVEAFGPGVEQRGTFADPHHGESFVRFTVSGFPSDSAEVSDLSAEMQGRLDKAKSFLEAQPEHFRHLIHADVIGHSDATGDAAANRKVSRRRARKVRDHLVGLGVSRSRFNDVIGKEDAECPATGSAPDCRKAQVFFYIFQGARETAK